MGYKASGGPIQDNTQTFSSTWSQNDAYLKWVRTALMDAGWESEKIMAYIKFEAVAITDGNKITLDGHVFVWFDTDPHGGGTPVPIGGDTASAVGNLKTIVAATIGWNSTRSGNNLTFTVPDDPGDLEYDGNGLECTLFPTGTVGLFDYSVDGPGTGRTWGGGYSLTCQASVEAPFPLTLDITTSGQDNFVTFATPNGIGVFNGLHVTNSWRIVANGFQFLLFCPGSTGAGTFMFAGSLFPARGSLQAHYITGPTNPVFTSGGNRSSGLVSIGVEYYVSCGAPYQAGNTSTVDTNPCLVFPGYGTGITGVDKLGNRIAGLDIVKDDLTSFPFDAFVAASVLNPSLPGSTFAVIGWIWDALIYSHNGVLDSSCDIDGSDGVVILSQDGTTQVSRGCLVVQVED